MKTVLNLRDAGGYRTSDGKKLRNGKLYRSGNLDKIKGEDLKLFLSLGIKTILDLRQSDEHKKRPLALKGIQTFNIPFNTTQKTRDVLRPFLSKKKEAGKEIIAVINRIYDDMVEGQMREVAQIFHRLAEPQLYPILIHCHIGKDRTGFIIALIHLALGIDIDSVLMDYLLSNEHLRPRLNHTMKIIRLFSFGTFPVANFQTSSLAMDKYILTVSEKINGKFGGIENYLEVCGVKSYELDSIRNILLEENVS